MSCPPPQSLESLLDDRLAPVERKVVADHLETCPECRTWLDQLVAERPLRAQLLSNPSADYRPTLEPVIAGEVQLNFLAPPVAEGELGTLEGYRVVSVLGQGGMGVVLQAFDPALDRVVALKVLRTDRLDAESRRRFVREGRALAQIRHDHVVNVYSVTDPPAGPPFLTMECLSGPSLAERISAERHLAPAAAAEIVMEVACGLHAAHAAGLVHRDIKPGNILYDAVSGRWKLSDFGLAQQTLAATPLTQSGTLAGTPAYMSPEQVQGHRRLDARSDIYSLGLTLYECLTGEVPFRGALHLVLQQIIRDEPRLPGQIQEGIPRDLETICGKAIAKEPAQRYDSAENFAADLARWKRGEPIHARATAWWERAARWIDRNRAVAVLAGSLAMVVLFANVALWTLWRTAEANAERERTQSIETERQKTEAQEQRAEAQASLDDALSAISQLAETVIDDDVIKQPQLTELRKRLARRWSEQCESILRHRDNNPNVLSALAAGRMQIALTLTHASTREEGLAEWTEAVTLLTKLRELKPNDPGVEERLGKALLQQGQLETEFGRFVEARSTFDLARDLLESSRRRDPSDSDRQALLITVHGGLARLASMCGDHAAAAEALKEICDTFRRFSEQNPENVHYQQNLGVAEHNLGMELQATGADPELVIAAYSRAEVVRRKLLETTAHVTHWDVNNLANTHRAQSEYLAQQGDLHEAEALMRQAVGLRERAVAETPNGTRYQIFLVGDCLELATLLARLDRRPEREPLIRQACQLLIALLETEQRLYTSGTVDHFDRLLDLAIQDRQVEPALSAANALLAELATAPDDREKDQERRMYQVRTWSRRAALLALNKDWSHCQSDLEHALEQLSEVETDSQDELAERALSQSLRIRLGQALWHLQQEAAAVAVLPRAADLDAALEQAVADIACQAALEDVDFRRFLDQNTGRQSEDSER